MISGNESETNKNVMLFVKAQNALTVEQSFNDKSIRKHDLDGDLKIFDTINNLLKATSMALNVSSNLNIFQAYDIVLMIINDYKDVKISELVYIFKQGKKGIYGVHYNKFDIETVVRWINGYFASEEYNTFLENRHRRHIERVELTDEQKKGWSNTLKQFTNALPENNTIASKLAIMSMGELRVLRAEYEEYNYFDGVEMINNELKKR